jgi:hypothetical protein
MQIPARKMKEGYILLLRSFYQLLSRFIFSVFLFANKVYGRVMLRNTQSIVLVRNMDVTWNKLSTLRCATAVFIFVFANFSITHNFTEYDIKLEIKNNEVFQVNHQILSYNISSM